MTEATIRALKETLDLAGNRHTVGDVVRLVLKNKAQMWLSGDGDAVVVTEIHRAPQYDTLHFWLGAGEREAVVRLHRQALEWGKEKGCKRATIVGRKGWTRALEGDGWKPTGLVLLERELVGDEGRNDHDHDE